MNQNVLQAKKEIVANIADNLKASGSVTVVSYQGLTVAEFQELRHKLAESNSSVAVFKNTLIRRALVEAKLPALDEILEGPNALVFSESLSAGPKVLAKFSRYHDALVIKGGLAEGKVQDAAAMKAIAKLPDRNGLLSMFLSVLNAPITRFAATLKAASENGQASAPAAN